MLIRLLNGHSFWQTSLHGSGRLRRPKARLENNQAHSSAAFHHMNDGQRDFPFQGNIDALYRYIASFRKEFCSS